MGQKRNPSNNMGIKEKLPIVVYTHTDMEDVWPMFFGQAKKYLSGFKLYVCLDKPSEKIKHKQIIYDDSKSYTERWKEILPQIEEEVILFLHEDMVLLGDPLLEDLETFYEYINTGEASTIKLIFVGNEFFYTSLDVRLVKNKDAKLSIQPTILKKETFSEALNKKGPLNIWEFEDAIQVTDKDFMVRYGNEKKRGRYHYDSHIFPYIATAISKGKWTYREYPKELDELFCEYGIDAHKRGLR